MAPKDHPSNIDKLLLNQNYKSTMQENHDDETISLCDLPIYGFETNTTDSNNSTKEDESFAFFSEDWLKNNKDSNLFPDEDNVFGRNWILPKQCTSRNIEDCKKRDHARTKVDLNSGSTRDREFAKFMSMNKGRNPSGHEKKRVLPPSGSLKSRWYYYGFGMARVPTEMNMSAIKSRQNRHRKNHSVCCGKENIAGFWEGKGLGRLIRDLSCDGQTQANSMVKASLVCISRI